MSKNYNIVPRAALAAVTLLGATRGWADAATHRAAAGQLLQAMNAEKTTNDAIDVAMRMQLETNSELRPYQDLMRAYLAKYMSWDALRDKYVAIYMETYTEEELKGLSEFYKTPLGQKLIASLPRVMERSADVGRDAVTGHMDELEAAIRARVNGTVAPVPSTGP